MNKTSWMEKVEEDKKDLTYTIDPETLSSLKEVLKNSKKYNLKKKRVWVNEAIEMLNNEENFKEIVINADPSMKTYIMDKIKMSFKERTLLAKIRSDVIREYPNIEAPQSAIIRAAIFNRLFTKK